jgi:hypothetical protein
MRFATNALSKSIRSLVFYGQATKGVRWMPWRWEAMKGVVSCEKPRGAAACFDPGMPEWGNPTGVMSRHPPLNP